MLRIRFGDTLRFTYTNHKGETAQRKVVVFSIDFTGPENTNYYPENTLTLHCWDLDKKDWRNFAISNIHRDSLMVL